jgi:excisionase family DNA binding protein
MVGLITKFVAPSGHTVKWGGAEVPLLVTVDEAARMISVNRRTIYKMAAVGKLELVRIGPRTTRVSGTSLLRLAGVEEDN